MARTALEIATALTPNADASALSACVEQAEGLFVLECARDDVPEGASPVIARMAMHLYTRIGAEGLQSQSYSGAGETLLADWPDELRRAIHRFRKLVTA